MLIIFLFLLWDINYFPKYLKDCSVAPFVIKVEKIKVQNIVSQGLCYEHIFIPLGKTMKSNEIRALWRREPKRRNLKMSSNFT